ncbi:MAG: hypothetical protein ACI9US_000327 [Gammaproteobacteria bacterium]|jgi:hypothetical protein
MRFVGIKAIWQQDIQTLHRVRSRLMQSRTQLVNHIRGLLTEYGIVIPKQIGQLRHGLPLVLADEDNELSCQMCILFGELQMELLGLDEKIDNVDKKVLIIHRESELSQRLGEVEGVGPLTATAFMSIVGNSDDVGVWLKQTDYFLRHWHIRELRQPASLFNTTFDCRWTKRSYRRKLANKAFDLNKATVRSRSLGQFRRALIEGKHIRVTVYTHQRTVILSD